MILRTIHSRPASGRLARRLTSFVWPLAISSLLLSGCQKSDRPPLGRVTGTITLDGRPLAGAGISFQQEGFHPSLGRTDTEGRYTLVYLRDVEGAVLGRHEVKIDVIPGQEGAPQRRLPDCYHARTQLSAEVAKGRHTINWVLYSNPVKAAETVSSAAHAE